MEILDRNIGFVFRDTSDDSLHLGLLDQETFEIQDVVMFPMDAEAAVFETLEPHEIAIVEIMEVDDFSIPHNYDYPDEFGSTDPVEFDETARVSIYEKGIVSHEYSEEFVDLAEVLDKAPEEFQDIVIHALDDIIGDE